MHVARIGIFDHHHFTSLENQTVYTRIYINLINTNKSMFINGDTIE